MPKFDVSGTVIIEATVEAADARAAVTEFTLMHNVEPDTVGSRAVLGLTEEGEVVLDGDEHEQEGEDGPLVLKRRVEGLGEADKVFEDEDEDAAQEPVPSPAKRRA